MYHVYTGHGPVGASNSSSIQPHNSNYVDQLSSPQPAPGNMDSLDNPCKVVVSEVFSLAVDAPLPQATAALLQVVDGEGEGCGGDGRASTGQQSSSAAQQGPTAVGNLSMRVLFRGLHVSNAFPLDSVRPVVTSLAIAVRISFRLYVS